MHTFETDTGVDETFAAFGVAAVGAFDDVDAAFGEAQGDKKAKAKKGPLTFKEMASAIENRHSRLLVRYMVAAGNAKYPDGAWAIEQWETTDKGKGGYRRLRYADNIQIREMYQALSDSDKFWRLIRGEGVALGPNVAGRPPIDPFGNTSWLAKYGDEDVVARWVEEHGDVEVQYQGQDQDWPDGCWAIKYTSPSPGEQFVDRTQLRYIAHETLGMPKPEPLNGGTEFPMARKRPIHKTVCPECFTTFQTTIKGDDRICPSCALGRNPESFAHSTFELLAQQPSVEDVFGMAQPADEINAAFGI